MMSDTGEDIGVPNNEDHSTPKASGKNTIALDLNDTLQKEQIITTFTVNKKTQCIVVGLNHKYEKKTVVSPLYKNWLKTIESFSACAKKKGVDDKHILALTDTLDDNYQRVLECFLPAKNGTASDDDDEDDDNHVKEHTVYKYSQDIPLAEEIVLDNKNVFLQIIDGKPVISRHIDLSKEKNIILNPHDDGLVSPIIPYKFKNVKEIEDFIKLAYNETIDSLYFKSKTLWKMFVVADKEQIILLAADSIFTFFQDLFASTHYTMVVGPPGSGKGAILVTFKYLGYRVVLASDMSGANLLDLLGSAEIGQITIAEDELDDIDEDHDKKRIYKVGVDIHEVVPRTLDGNKSSRSSKYYLPFGYKIFAAEESSDSSKMGGFNDRKFDIKSIKGKPLFYVKELAKPKDTERYRKIISKVDYFRKLTLVYRLLHAKDPIKDVRTNIDGRPLELTGPQICLFNTDTLSKNKSALKEILPVLSSFLRQKGEMSSRTLEAVIHTVLLDLFANTSSCCPHEAKNDDDDDDDSTHTYYKIENGILCDSVRKAVDGENISGKRAFLSTEFDKVTHHEILKRCRDIFKAKDDWAGSGNDKARALRFDKEIVLKVGSTFEVIPEIKILDNDYNKDANDDQTIWKDWDRSDGSEDRASEDLAEDKVDTTATPTNTNTAGDNHTPLVSSAAGTAVPNKTTAAEVAENGSSSTSMAPTATASVPAASTTTTTAANNNVGTTGQLYSDLGHIQASISTKSEDHAAKAAENIDVYSTIYKTKVSNKLEKNPFENVSITNSKSLPGFGPISTKVHIQNDPTYSRIEQKVVPLSQSNISKQETHIEDEEENHEAAKNIYSKSKTKTQDLGLPAIPCIFCYSYRTPIEFDLGNHLLESHRMDLVKLTIGKGSMEYRINHAIQLGKNEIICNDNADGWDNEEEEEEDDNDDGTPEACQ